MDNNVYASSIDNGVGQFVAEASIDVTDETPLFELTAYPEEQRELILECNRRIEEANIGLTPIMSIMREKAAEVELAWNDDSTKWPVIEAWIAVFAARCAGLLRTSRRRWFELESAISRQCRIQSDLQA